MGRCNDPKGQIIAASNYDQSCATDRDCVAVAEGDFCVPGAATCPSAAINSKDLPRYQADVAKTQAALCSALSTCGNLVARGPCCRGTCKMNADCR
jgi:hypothetical protein